MKKTLALTIPIILISLIILLFPIWQKKQVEIKAREETRNQVQTILAKQHPDGLWLIQQIKELPLQVKINPQKRIKWESIELIEEYILKPELKEILFSLGTLIHESSHIYHSRAGLTEAANKKLISSESRDFLKIWLTPEKQFLIKEFPVFPSREIAKQIPLESQTTRFETYISKSNNSMATQQSGIFGLIDEWNAYYQGIRTEYNLLNYVYKNSKKIPESELKTWLDYASLMSNEHLSYFEFKLYILAYLYQSKTKNPLIYESLQKDQNIKSALSSINLAYQKLIPEYLTIRKHFDSGKSTQTNTFMEKLNEKENNLKAAINQTIYQDLEKEFMLKS